MSGWRASAALLFIATSWGLINALRQSTRMATDLMYDMPVSNHGARVRMIVYSKKIEDNVRVAPPSEIGGLKSPEYLALNIQGKMPLLVTDDGLPIPESDTIARYVIEKYASKGPSFMPTSLPQKMLCEQICRTHDLYISCVQGCMYRAPGSVFGGCGTDRKAALAEVKKQLGGIESAVTAFDKKYPSSVGDFLCGKEISLADATLYPTVVFCVFMLPQFFNMKESEFLGPRLLKWWNFMSTSVSEAKRVREEIEWALKSWKESGRWDPIVAEMK